MAPAFNYLVSGRRCRERRNSCPVVRVVAAGHVLLGSVIDGRHAAGSEREGQRLLQLTAVRAVIVEAFHVMVIDERNLILHLRIIGCRALQHGLQTVHIVGVVPEYLAYLLRETEVQQAHAGFVGELMVLGTYFVHAEEPFAEGEDRLVVVDGSHETLLPAKWHMLHRVHSNAVNAQIEPHFDGVLQVGIHGAVIVIQVGKVVQVL